MAFTVGPAVLQTTTTVGTGAGVLILAANMYPRSAITVQNNGATTIYLGSSTVTADTTATGGFQLTAGQSLPIDAPAGLLLYATSSGAGGKVTTLEVLLAS